MPQDPNATANSQDVLAALLDIPMSAWRWFDTATGLPHWVLPAVAVVGFYVVLRIGTWIALEVALSVDHWATTDPKDTSRVLRGDLRKDSEAAPAEPDKAPRSDRWWQCRYCGLEGAFYGTVQQEAEDALAHEAMCRARPDAPTVRRCPECAAPIDPVDPVDDLLDGLFEDDDAEPGLTGWKPGMPAWGTPPLLPLRNQARADLFRQMMSDALRRSKG